MNQILKPKLLTTLKDYNKKQFFNDIKAGIIVAIIALPLSIALAISSGVSPEQGLHTAIIAGFLISLLGGSRVQIGGPTGAFMIIVYGVVMKFGVEGLIISTIMAGIMLVIMGLLRLGAVVKFIPYPIITGFTSGIALTIFTTQIKDFFGLTIHEMPSEFIEKWFVYLKHFNTINISALIVGVLSLLILIYWPKINKQIPGAFIALVVSSVLVYIFKIPVETIGSRFGELSSALPKVSIPNIDLDTIKILLPSAFTIAMLGAIESLLSAVVSDGMIGSKHRSNMELIGQGVANVASGLFGGIPATGAIARTVANIKNGGRTPVAGIVHALTLLLILVLFMPLAANIPLATLAAILIIVSYNMSEWEKFVGLFKAPKSDLIVLLVTFSLTVFVDLVVAIGVGMILAMILFIKRMADISHVNIQGLDSGEETQIHKLEEYYQSKDTLIYKINGPFFFGTADLLVDNMKHLGYETKNLILDMNNIYEIDATAINAMHILTNHCDKQEIKVYIINATDHLNHRLTNNQYYMNLTFITSIDDI